MPALFDKISVGIEWVLVDDGGCDGCWASEGSERFACKLESSLFGNDCDKEDRIEGDDDGGGLTDDAVLAPSLLGPSDWALGLWEESEVLVLL